MFQFKTLAAAPALMILMSGTAHAALSADQVWQSWKDGAMLAGLTITAATESSAGGVLSLNGITIAPAGTTEGFKISDMTLTEQGDGSVSIVPGASMGVDSGEGDNTVKIAVQNDGLTIIAREDGDALVYDYSANTLAVTYDVQHEGYSWDPEAAKPIIKDNGNVAFEGLTGSYSDSAGANRTFGLDLVAAVMSYEMNTDDAGMEMKTAATSKTSDVEMGIDVTMPSTTPLMSIQTPADFRKVMDEGFAVAVSFAQGGNSGTASQEDSFSPYDMTITGQPSKGTMLFNKDMFSMQFEGTGIELVMNSATVPAPIEISVGAMMMNLVVPMMATTPADVVLQMKLDQLTLGDGVWGLFDAGGALTRDPMDLNIDIAGKTTMDVIGMIEAEEMGGMPPIPAPESLDITDISVRVAGAALDANGALTFDNSMGFPMPLGEATVNVSGANALIDGLIATGLLQEQDAMGARMMMGMFMAPAGDDALTSKIEFKEGFSIFVNGQQVQ